MRQTRNFSEAQKAYQKLVHWTSKNLPQKVQQALKKSFTKKLEEEFTYPDIGKITYHQAFTLQMLQFRLFAEGEIEDYWPVDWR